MSRLPTVSLRRPNLFLRDGVYTPGMASRDSGATVAVGKSSAQRRRQRRERIALGVGAVLLVLAVVVFLQSRTDEGPGPTHEAQSQAEALVPTDTLKKGGTLSAEGHKVAVRFVETAVGRTSLDEAWDLVTLAFRSGVTRARWSKGELPVPPFPVRDLETTGFDVVESGPNKVLLQVLLVPKVGTDYVPTRYDLTLERTSAKAPWKVSYAAPYSPPGMYANPE